MPKELPTPNKPWFVYLIECQDDSIYTGITINVKKRYAAHVNGKGARYTRIRPPQKLLAVIEFKDHASAASSEYTIKQWTATQKRAFALKHSENEFIAAHPAQLAPEYVRSEPATSISQLKPLMPESPALNPSHDNL
ncbi:hypothetical protein C1H71_16740 [Iodobacter fluviatilis]|uniref:GIY-YIG domain-containing protein n=1 Tax=Iodobacter fluviatilis TaxID=537 RepID=A0A7G3GD30_9NEIS|nr:hypothetical protein C1H71_16740 [Iodobacter fluviatilis]